MQPVCTTEIGRLALKYKELSSKGVKIATLSADPVRHCTSCTPHAACPAHSNVQILKRLQSMYVITASETSLHAGGLPQQVAE